MIDRQFRGAVGFALIAGGVIVGILGYLGVSRETEVAFQLPYFASAGVAALMLFGAGAAVLLSAQLERDSVRLDELEDAIRQMAEELRVYTDEVTDSRSQGAADVLDLTPGRSSGASTARRPSPTDGNGRSGRRERAS